MPAGEVENLVVMILFRLHLSWHFYLKQKFLVFKTPVFPLSAISFPGLRSQKKDTASIGAKPQLLFSKDLVQQKFFMTSLKDKL